MGTKYPSGEYDPAVILAVRNEIRDALDPVHSRLDRIDARLAQGDTALALLGERWEAHTNYEPTKQPATERMGKRERTSEIIRVAVITGIASTLGGLAAVWMLHGMAQQVVK